MKKNTLLLAISMCMLVTDSFGQATQEWVQSYTAAGTQHDHGKDIETDAAGNVYVAGSTNLFGSAADIVTMKYNASGVRQWVNNYNGSGSGKDEVRDMVVDANGNVYVTGASWGATVLFDMVTIKYNSAGVRQWTVRFDGFYKDDEANSIAVDASGNVFVAGFTDKGNEQKDFCLVKYNSAGTKLWSRTINGTGNAEDIATEVRLDAAGNIYLSGSSAGSGKDFLTVKYNSLGIVLWAARYTASGSLDDEPADMEVDSDGSVYVTGSSFTETTATDYATVKYNSAGVQQWVKRYNNTVPFNVFDDPRELAIDASGNVIVTGGCGFHPDYDIFTIKYNSAGSELWTSRVDGGVQGIDMGWDIAIDPSGNIFIGGGATTINTPIQSDFATIKYSASGTILWKKFYNGTQGGGDHINAIKLFTTSPLLGSKVYVYVTGYEYTTSGTIITTVKYSQTTFVASPSVVEDAGAMPPVLKIVTFPNPAKQQLGIQYTTPQAGRVQLVMYDLAGRKVQEWNKGTSDAGIYTTYLNREGLPKGVYYLTVYFKAGPTQLTDTRQVILE